MEFPANLKIPTKTPSVVALATRKYKYQPINFKGIRIFWRDDLFKLTCHNIKRLEQGKAPIGKDGQSVTLHHLTQTNNGSLCMMSYTDHHIKYPNIIHGIHPLQISDPTKQWLSSLGDKRIVPIAEPVNRKEFEQFKKCFWQHFYQEITGEVPNRQEDGFEKVTVAGSSSSSSSSKRKEPKQVAQHSKSDPTLLKEVKKLKQQILVLRTHLAEHSTDNPVLTDQEMTQMQTTLTLLEELQADLKAELSAKQHPRNKQSFSMNA